MQPTQIEQQLAEALFAARQKSNEERLIEETKNNNKIQLKMGMLAASITLLGLLISGLTLFGSSYIAMRDTVRELKIAQVQNEKERSNHNVISGNIRNTVEGCKAELNSLKLELITTKTNNEKLLDRIISLEKLLERRNVL